MKFQKKIEEVEGQLIQQFRQVQTLKEEEEIQKAVLEIVKEGTNENKERTIFYLSNYLQSLQQDILIKEAEIQKNKLKKYYYLYSETAYKK